MGRITHFVHQSLDGFIAGPNGEFDWPVMGPELSQYSRDLSANADVFLYGRKVWEMMAGYWPHVEDISDDPHDLAFAPLWRAARKVVVSRTLTDADVAGTEIANTEVVADVEGLAARRQTDNLLLFAGRELAGALTERGLIDEYLVLVHPVVLGGGAPTFTAGLSRFGLTLAESRVFDSSVVLLRHTR